VAAAIAISGWVGATLLGAILFARGWLPFDRAAARRLPRIAVATVLMGAALIGAQALLAAMLDGASIPGRIAALMLLVGIGLLVYLASLQALGVARLRDLVAAMRHGP
jgi:putative peptidoglycan lipid II flippase